MKALFRYSLLLLSFLLFALVVADLRAAFQYLAAASAWSLLALAVVGLIGANRPWPNHSTGRTVAVLLFLGALSALLVRTLGYERAAMRSVAVWESARESEGERIATKVSSEFEAICAAARRAARQLARSSEIAVAVEGSDAEDYVSGAFEALESFPLPRAHPLGAPGTTLYDVWRRPIAWSGENISLGPVLEQPYGVPDADIFILEQGVYTFVVAIEPLQSRLGFVSVEIPLIADRRLQNRYLEDYDALSTWLGRNVDTAFVYFGGRGRELAEILQTRGDPFWGGPEDAPRLYFGLESQSDGKLLGVSSVAAEAPVLSRLDASRFESAASIAVVLAALLVLITIARARVAPARVVITIWAVRLVILWSDVPLSFGFDLKNPAHYASSLFFDLTRSPIDFLLTTAALLASVVLLARYLRTSKNPEGFRLAYALGRRGRVRRHLPRRQPGHSRRVDELELRALDGGPDPGRAPIRRATRPRAHVSRGRVHIFRAHFSRERGRRSRDRTRPRRSRRGVGPFGPLWARGPRPASDLSTLHRAFARAEVGPSFGAVVAGQPLLPAGNDRALGTPRRAQLSSLPSHASKSSLSAASSRAP